MTKADYFDLKHGLMLIEAQLKYCESDTAAKIILLYEVDCVTLRAHENVFHSGLENTLANVRLIYWIIKRR